MSSRKILKLKSILKANGGCGCGKKATDVVEPKPKSKSKSNTSSSSSEDHKSTRCPRQSILDDDQDYTSTTFSVDIDTSPQYCSCGREQHDHTKTVSPCPKIQDSFAVVKDSDDPYQDFRQSMLQMIVEKEIYSRNDLQQLLHCFLQLNSPHHHEVILRAFMEIWNNGGIPVTCSGLGEATSTASPPCS
ncbi:Transcription repressor OFP6 [Sesamum alatum]|uniref:Transcription repressor n=1 Tax=Sesamum alatum TaxID=300844 RepID=A0AAE2CZX2_9LAMI|nr:Transcription repressor OFP6 [Sesamum alatum]